MHTNGTRVLRDDTDVPRIRHLDRFTGSIGENPLIFIVWTGHDTAETSGFLLSGTVRGLHLRDPLGR